MRVVLRRRGIRGGAAGEFAARVTPEVAAVPVSEEEEHLHGCDKSGASEDLLTGCTGGLLHFGHPSLPSELHRSKAGGGGQANISSISLLVDLAVNRLWIVPAVPMLQLLGTIMIVGMQFMAVKVLGDVRRTVDVEDLEIVSTRKSAKIRLSRSGGATVRMFAEFSQTRNPNQELGFHFSRVQWKWIITIRVSLGHRRKDSTP